MPWRSTLRRLASVLPAAAILLFLACTPSHHQSTFDAAGPVADKQLTLFYILLWPAVFVFVVVVGILIFAVTRYRRRPGDTEIPAQVHGHTQLEITWTILPAVMLAVVAVPTIIYIFDISSKPANPDMTITVTGHQWWWEFDYGEELGVITANQLHVPVDKIIQLDLRSDDVLHSFWIPKLAGKVDVVPNNENFMWFEADSGRIGKDEDDYPVTFYGQCAEFCGVAHAHMSFRVVVETHEGFDAWVANYKRLASEAKDDEPPDGRLEAQGATLFTSKGCALCHTLNGPAPEAMRGAMMPAFRTGSAIFPAPNLTNLGTRQIIAAGRLDNNRQNLIRWLTDPEEVKPGNRMGRLATVYTAPELKMKPQEILALAEYLLSLK